MNRGKTPIHITNLPTDIYPSQCNTERTDNKEIINDYDEIHSYFNGKTHALRFQQKKPLQREGRERGNSTQTYTS